MKLFKLDTKSQFTEDNICLAIGNFDGFHKGHSKIVNELIKVADKNNYSSAIMSFDPHPRQYFSKKIDNFNIYSKEDKIRFLEKLKINTFIEFAFDNNLSELSAEQFILQILVNKLNIKSIIVGKEFKFGKDRKGNFEILKEFSKKYNFEVYLVDSVMIDESSNKFSSSIIRENLINGDIEKANFALGRNWHITGKVIQGDKRARQIDFPTANIKPGNHIFPKKGVYCVQVYHGNNRYFGISNFGQRPTVDGINLLLETHIFGFNEEIYGNDLTVEFLTFIRPEQKFIDFDQLTNQIKKDIEIAKKYHQI